MTEKIVLISTKETKFAAIKEYRSGHYSLKTYKFHDGSHRVTVITPDNASMPSAEINDGIGPVITVPKTAYTLEAVKDLIPYLKELYELMSKLIKNKI